MFLYQVHLPLGPIKLITLYHSVTRYFPWKCLHVFAGIPASLLSYIQYLYVFS